MDRCAIFMAVALVVRTVALQSRVLAVNESMETYARTEDAGVLDQIHEELDAAFEASNLLRYWIAGFAAIPRPATHRTSTVLKAFHRLRAHRV